MRIFTLFFIIFILIFRGKASISCDDNELAVKIAEVLIENYDKKTSDTILEKVIHSLSRKSYINMLEIWKKNFMDISKTEFKIDPSLNQLFRIIEKNLPEDQSIYFRSLFYRMMMLTLENFQLYFNAVKEYSVRIELNEITDEIIDQSLNNLKYYRIQTKLYSEEKEITSSIRTIMFNPAVKNKIGFYIFVFDLLMKYRNNTIDYLMNEYLAKIQNSLQLSSEE